MSPSAGLIPRKKLALGLWAFCLLSIAPPMPSGRGVIMELRNESGERFDRFEASGIAYYRDRLVIVDDIVSSLFVFDRKAKLIQTVTLQGFPPDGAKFEDLAVDTVTGDFFAVGSHSGTDRAFFEATSVLLRFGLRESERKLEVDAGGLERLPLHSSFEKLGLWRPGAMKIEGLALDPAAGDLYVGLREPTDRARIYRLALAALEDGARSGVVPAPELELSFDAGSVAGTPFCVSALLWIPDRQGLLVATSTEDETTHRFQGNRLWFYSRASGIRLVQDTFDEGLKAEGLAAGDGQIFIGYDNDQDDTSIPSQMRVVPQLELLGAPGETVAPPTSSPN